MGNCLHFMILHRLNTPFFAFRNKHALETAISILLAVLVAVLGYRLLAQDFFKDFWIFLFCFVVAGCQFSLVKV